MDLPIDINAFNCDNCLNGIPCGCLLQDSKVTLLIENLVQQISSRGCFEVCVGCIDLTIVNNAFTESESFFSKPLEEKLKTFSKDRAKRGYSPVETENFSSLLISENKAVAEPNDNVEKFRVGPLRNPYDGDGTPWQSESPQLVKDIRANFFPNDWNNLSVSFRKAVECYYESISEVTMKILKVLAFSFGFPTNAFLHSVDRHTSILSLNHYPAVAPSPLEGCLQRLWMAEHTDVSLVSIIAQCTPLSPSDAVAGHTGGCGGLQVRTNSTAKPGEEDDSDDDDDENEKAAAEWMAYPRHGSCNLVVLVGSCMTAITRNLLPAARHRVMVCDSLSDFSSLSSPSLSSSSWSRERYSMVFFFAPNVDSPMSMHRGQEAEGVLRYSQWRQERVKAAMKSLKGR